MVGNDFFKKWLAPQFKNKILTSQERKKYYLGNTQKIIATGVKMLSLYLFIFTSELTQSLALFILKIMILSGVLLIDGMWLMYLNRQTIE